MFRIFEKCISRSKPKLWGALILTKSLEQGPLGVHGFQSVAKLFFNNIFMQTNHEIFRISILIQWSNWPGSVEKVLDLARNLPSLQEGSLDPRSKTRTVRSSSHRVIDNQHRSAEASKRRPMGWWKKPTWTSLERTSGMWHIWSIAAEVLYLHRFETYRFTSLWKQWHRKDEQNYLHQPQTSNRGRLCSRGPYEILRHTHTHCQHCIWDLLRVFQKNPQTS